MVASLVYLTLGLLAQLAIVLDVWLGFNPLAYTTVAAAEQLLLLGWLTQLGLALTYDRWLRPAEAAPARSPTAVFILFNIGLPLAILGQPGLALFGRAWMGAAGTLGALLQLVAGLVFVGEVRRVLRKTP